MIEMGYTVEIAFWLNGLQLTRSGKVHACVFAGCVKCWAASYQWCAKEQVVDLWAEGVTEECMDELQPAIYIGEW